MRRLLKKGVIYYDTKLEAFFEQINEVECRELLHCPKCHIKLKLEKKIIKK